MFKYLITALTVSLFATSVSAGTSVTLYGKVQSSTPIIENVIQEVPSQFCYLEEVPVYSRVTNSRQPSTADVMAGIIVGGLIGNQVGGGKGKDAATIIGAIIGADVVNKKNQTTTGQVITGYHQQERCETRYNRKTVQMVMGFETTIKVYNELYVFDTTTQYSTGTRVPLTLRSDLN
jgi:uncharacterized protein YcfJ